MQTEGQCICPLGVACHRVYLRSHEVVVRVRVLQHGQQTLWRRDGALEMRTSPHLKPLQDDFGSIQLFAQSLQLFQSTAASTGDGRWVTNGYLYFNLCVKSAFLLTLWCIAAPPPSDIWAFAPWSESCFSKPPDKTSRRWGSEKALWSWSCICRNLWFSWLVSVAWSSCWVRSFIRRLSHCLLKYPLKMILPVQLFTRFSHFHSRSC